MAAADHLSPRLFHSTNAFLQPGDEVKPGFNTGQRRHSEDFSDVGHSDFAWASKYSPKDYFGKRHYEVEPTGLTEDYKPHETPGGVMTRMDSPVAEKRMIHSNDDLHAHNVVSLAPFKVLREVDKRGNPYE